MWNDRTVTTASPSLTEEIRRALWVVFGPDRVDTGIEASSLPATLGRDRVASGVPFGDAQMSRKHARLHESERGGPWVLEDLAAKNGTYLNGVRVERGTLEDGDVIRLGETLFVLEEWAGDEPALGSVGEREYVGRSHEAARVRSEVAQAADSGLSTTLLGPTGSGKEVLARVFHERTGRNGAFVAVNCAAIPRELVESSLFGHKKGAFSGALADKEGYFQAADGGTLFLDEVAELSPSAQAALLRVLEDHVVTPVGATKGQRCDVRVIAATHVDLPSAAAQGLFRQDLWNRLGRWTVEVPSLTKRRRDIVAIARRALPAGVVLTVDAVEGLLLADLTGNVRELLAAVTRAASVSQPAGRVELASLPASFSERVRARRSEQHAEPRAKSSDERTTAREPRPPHDELLEVLTKERGNIVHVAKHYGRTRKQVYRWIEQYGIDLDSIRPPEES